MPISDKILHKYLRTKKRYPSVWCSGCGIGIVMGSLIRVADKLQLDQNNVALVAGIGCSGRLPVYLDFNTLHTTHGRALSFATGVKLAKPDLTTIVIMGDGDAVAIGGNHFIHTARRNINLVAIVINNLIYGLTGGQVSPTTPTGAKSTTSRAGNLDLPFDICNLALGAGARYVARGTVYHANQLDGLIEGAIANPGFSVVEVISNCHTFYGRINLMPDPVDMLKWMRDHAVQISNWDKLSEEEQKDKFKIGVFRDNK